MRAGAVLHAKRKQLDQLNLAHFEIMTSISEMLF